ncbi:nucleotidyltransferase family protein [Gluconobacter oxydans]|uniref:nucleotidyltransferase family protein n=1 Tax=Gluconobacter oxydans TaxID=442 RepID=UPI0039E74022
MTLPVLVLAGSRDGENDVLAKLGQVSHKALLPVAGQPMLARVLDTIARTPGLGPVTISIENPDCIRDLAGDATILRSAPSPSESVAEAIARIGTPCLVTTADHALLRPEWIQEFLAKAQGCDLAAGVALRATVERDVPGTKRTYIHLSDMSFSGCNLFLIGTPKGRNVIELWKRLQQNRKRPLRMALTLGIGTLLRAVTRTLDSTALYRRIRTLTGANVRLVTLSDGRAAVDVDKPSDLTLAEKILAQTTP